MLHKNYFKRSRVPIKKIVLIGFLPNFLKKTYYRIIGYKIGKNVKFSLGSILDIKYTCEVQDGTTFGFLCIVKAQYLKIAKNTQIRSFVFIDTPDVEIGNDVIISESSSIRAGHISPKSKIVIKDNVHVFPHTIIDPSYPVLLDEECAVGFYTNIYTHGAYKNVLEGYKVTYGEVEIGKRVELTYSVFVSPGVSIGDDAVIGYGSMVSADIPEGAFAAGIPAKIKRTKEEFAPVPSNSEKIEILINIINDFSEYLLCYYNFECSKINSDHWIFRYQNDDYSVRLYVDFNNAIYSTNDIALIMSQMHIDKKILNDNKIQYFDFFSLMCSKWLDPFASELKSFIGRYGIRFKIYE